MEPTSYPATLIKTGDDPAEGRLDLCEALHVKRHLLARHATHRLFFDPAWDMLVDLYVAQARHLQISFSSLAYGANVPLSTASRLVQEMERHQLVTKVVDIHDRRRTCVQITAIGEALINMILDAVEERRLQSAARRDHKAAQWRAALGSHVSRTVRRLGLYSS